ncbi:unnamed protein product [Pieris macdunnoughi]|uniref:CAAX prenyl protease 2 n=1 Tax=Pieris macdunnoughi TaxID=345717 RepID=A0A821TA80_9NEOP|nr:unnamed protein product [Pieris macdunnoughi]
MIPWEWISIGNCLFSVVACVFLTISYVASLYVWRTKENRDHPSTIKRRFFSVFIMMMLAPLFTYYFLNKPLDIREMYEKMGLREEGFVQALILPLLLTVILFLGPLSMQLFSGAWRIYIEPMYWISCWQDLVWVRNHIMAPLSEEWVFRACMMPLLLQCLNPMSAVFIGPLLFGIAHFHHVFEQIKAGYEIKTALIVSTFQFTYTTMFGAYSSFLFLRSGHFIAPLMAHIFCNHMGFPNFSDVALFPPLERFVIVCNYLLGFGLWCYLLNPMTSPDLYYNKLNFVT